MKTLWSPFKNYEKLSFLSSKERFVFCFFFLYLMRDCYIKIILASSFVFSLTSWQKTCKAFLNWSNFQVGNKIKLIKKSYLENFLPAQKIKSPPGIAVTDDKKPWTRKRAARSNCSNRVLKPFTSTWQKFNDTFTNKSFLPLKNNINIFKTVSKHKLVLSCYYKQYSSLRVPL